MEMNAIRLLYIFHQMANVLIHMKHPMPMGINIHMYILELMRFPGILSKQNIFIAQKVMVHFIPKGHFTYTFLKKIN